MYLVLALYYKKRFDKRGIEISLNFNPCVNWLHVHNNLYLRHIMNKAWQILK